MDSDISNIVAPCGCMTEEDEDGTERVFEHSSQCREYGWLYEKEDENAEKR